MERDRKRRREYNKRGANKRCELNRKKKVRWGEKRVTFRCPNIVRLGPPATATDCQQHSQFYTFF